MDQKDKKRYMIAAIYGGIIIFLIVFVILKLMPNETCSDGIKNQNEEDVDCGGVCAKACAIKLNDSITVKNTGFVESGLANKYDAYAIIANPNKKFGSGSFDYTFSLTDSAGKVVAQKTGSGFILPGEEKYLVEVAIEAEAVPSQVRLDTKNINWKEFPDFERPALRVINKNFNEIGNAAGSSEATGVLRNESPYDFNEIRIEAILKDASGKIIALNSTKLNTVQTGENREFKFLWPYDASRSVANMEIQAEVNVFASDTFVERYFGEQVF